MRIEQNKDVSNSIQAQDRHKKEIDSNPKKKGEKQTEKNDQSISIDGVDLFGGRLVETRQAFAKRQAYKVVSEAFKSEKKIDRIMEHISDEITRLQELIGEIKLAQKERKEQIEQLKGEYGIDTKSLEYRSYFNDPSLPEEKRVKVSDEDAAKFCEFAQRVTEIINMGAKDADDLKKAEEALQANVYAHNEIRKERDKSQDMVNAQEAADGILDAANEETKVLLAKEAVDHIDEEQEEREEQAKEASEKKKEEKKEEAEKLEKEALQQEMVENIKEHMAENQRTSADIKRATARKERAQADEMDVVGAKKTVITEDLTTKDIQSEVDIAITKILNELSLVNEDIKGNVVDELI